ncbi:MAG: hypothetical protein KF747_06355, partial [Nitrospira sp.]|nr:hypothetical protein [Nitrospira sp.]
MKNVMITMAVVAVALGLAPIAGAQTVDNGSSAASDHSKAITKTKTVDSHDQYTKTVTKNDNDTKTVTKDSNNEYTKTITKNDNDTKTITKNDNDTYTKTKTATDSYNTVKDSN